MDTQRTREIVTRWFDDIGRNDMDAVLDRLAPNVFHELPRHERNAIVENLGVHVGRDAVAASFAMRGDAMKILEYTPREVVAEGNKAFVTVFCTSSSTRTGVTWSYEASHRLVLDDDGKIIFWTVYFDPTGEVVAFSADLGERLVEAVRRGDEQAVSTLLTHGADPSFRDRASGLTVLMIAAGRGDSGIVRRLLDAGADLYTVDSRAGGTALHKAIQGGDLQTVRMLVEAGSFVDAVAPTTGHTPLLDAFWYKRPAIVGYLLERNASLNLSTHYGFTMREHFDYALGANALGREKLVAADALLKDRVAADEAAANGHELIAAVLADDADRVRQLVEGGYDVDTRYPVVNGFNDAHTALLVAAREGRAEIVRILLAAGAEINATEPTFGAVPLHKAVYNGHADVTAILVGTPGVDLNFQGSTNGYTPLHDALWHGFEDCARILLDAGCRLDLVGHDGKTPHDLAAEVFGADHPLTIDIARAAGR